MTYINEHPGLAIALIVFLGAAAQWIAWRVRLPAILPLLLIGFLIGPVFGLLLPSELFGNELLFPAVSLAVGLILFEGGLTLRLNEVTELRKTINRLISVGALITWLASAVAAYYIVGLSFQLSILFGALIIVTGPTVIGPLIRNVRPTGKISSILKWEGILIDPVGALVAVLVFEFMLAGSQTEAITQTFISFFTVVIVGSATGFVGGFILSFLLRRRLIPDYLINVSALALVFIVFAVSNTLAHESGLLATTIMGMVVANIRTPNRESLLTFKEDLVVLLISLLFIVLAANIDINAFIGVLNWQSVLLVAVIMLVIRPLNIFASSIGSSLTLREKLFMSWIAPRGIVAASVTALFGFELIKEGFAGAEALEPLVFFVIVMTVVLNSLTAKPLANALGVAQPGSQGFLIMGAHPVARQIAKGLQDEGIFVRLADTNWSNVAAARVDGLNAYYGNVLSDHSEDELDLAGIGNFLALTSNDEANALASLRFAREFGTGSVYQLEPAKLSERSQLGEEQGGRFVFQDGTTFAELNHLFAKGAKLTKTKITEKFGLDDFESLYGEDYVPMFVMSGNKLDIVTEDGPQPSEGSQLIAMVKEKAPA